MTRAPVMDQSPHQGQALDGGEGKKKNNLKVFEDVKCLLSKTGWKIDLRRSKLHLESEHAQPTYHSNMAHQNRAVWVDTKGLLEVRLCLSKPFLLKQHQTNSIPVKGKNITFQMLLEL